MCILFLILLYGSIIIYRKTETQLYVNEYALDLLVYWMFSIQYVDVEMIKILKDLPNEGNQIMMVLHSDRDHVGIK